MRRLAGALFVAVAFGFLFLIVFREAGQLKAQTWTVRPVLMGASLLLHIAGLLCGVATWRLVIRAMGYRVPFRQLARIWFLSGLGRYIPGKIWQFVGAAHIGRGSGLPAAVTVTALAAHTLFFLIGAALVSLYLVPEGLGISGSSLIALWWLAPALFILVHPAVVGWALSLIRRITKKELVAWTAGWGVGAGIVMLAVVCWVITGAALHLFILSLTPLPPSAFLSVIGMNALSFIVGNLVFIAPAGLGAKEGTLTLLLAAHVAGPAAALIAVAARLWTVAAEVLPALFLLRDRDRADEAPVLTRAGTPGRPGVDA